MNHGTAPVGRQPPDRITLVAAGLVAALLCASSGELALRLDAASQGHPIIWPPAGLSLAALVMFGWRMLPGCLAGLAFAHWWVGATTGALFAAAATEAGGLAAAYALLLRFAPDCRLNRLRDVLVLNVGASGTCALACSASFFLGVQGQSMPVLGALSCSLGVMAFTPLVLAWRGAPPRGATACEALLATAPAALAVVVAWLVFSGWLGTAIGSPSVAFVVISCMVWAAISAGPRLLTATLLVCLGLSLWGWIRRSGPFGGVEPLTGELLTQLFAIACLVTALLMHALVQQARNGERRARAGERAVQAARRHLDAVIDAIPSPVLVKDDQLRYVAMNAEFQAFAGRSSAELLGCRDTDVFPPALAGDLADNDRRALAGEQVENERRFSRRPGHECWVHVRVRPLDSPDGRRLVISTFNDITSLKLAERQLRYSEQRFRDFTESAGEFAWECDAQGHYTFLSPRVSHLLQRGAESIVGQHVSKLVPPGEYDRILEWLSANKASDGSFRDFEHRIVRADGEMLWVSVSAVRVRDEHGRFAGWRGTTRDITERKSTEERISLLATRDGLTGLPNRVLFNDRLEQAFVNARRKDESVALMFLDLDRFKHVNDSLGHHVGDLLLKEAAQRMQACIRKGDTLSRLGGDEFVVTLEGLQHAEAAAQVAQKIIAALARPMELGGHTMTSSCSIGIAIFPGDADDPATLVRNADTAMYHAKEKGRRNFQFFSPEMTQRAMERHELEKSLRVALERGEFALLWQPRADIATGRLAAVEALLRWHHPEKGLLPPARFLAVAEETGLIVGLGQWVLTEACGQIRRWADSGYPVPPVAVNVAPRQFANTRQLFRAVNSALDSSDLDPQQLELELTEQALLQDAGESVAALRQLSRAGLSLAVDDFGTGYSSLSLLKQLPLRTLKIDRSFVRNMATDKDSEAIVATMITMAHGLGLRVVAQGVEQMAQLAALKRLGCDDYQGYLLSKPLTTQEFALRYLAPGHLNFGG